MSIKLLVIVSMLGLSSMAFADPAKKESDTTTTVTTDKTNDRMWTLQAAENHAAKSNDSKTVTDPGVWVTAQRDPHDKK